MFDLFGVIYDNGYSGFAFAKASSGVKVGDEVITEFDLGTKGRVVSEAKWVSDTEPAVEVIKSVETLDRILKRIIEVES